MINLIWMAAGSVFTVAYYTLRPKRFRKNPAALWMGMFMGQILSRQTEVDTLAREEEIIQTVARTRANIKVWKDQMDHVNNLEKSVRDTVDAEL